MNTFSLKSILIVTLTFVIIITSAIQGLYMYTSVSAQIADNMTDIASSTVKVYEQSLNQYLNSLVSLAASVKRSPIIESALRSSKDFLSQNTANENVASYLENISFTCEGITGTLIFTEERGLYNYAKSFGFYDFSFLPEEALKQKILADSTSGFVPTFSNTIVKYNSAKSIFSYYTKLYYGNRYIGVVCILVNSNVFKNVVKTSLSSGEHLLLVSGDQLIYPYGNTALKELVANTTLDNGILVTFENKTYLLMHTILTNGWSMVDLIPMEKIDRSTTALLKQMILGFLLAFLLYFVCIYFISNIMGKDLSSLTMKMATVGILPHTKMKRSRIKEIAMLNQQFDDMTIRLDELMDTVKEEQREIDRGQLELLRAQINPHFLYNTLDAINWMALEHGADDISGMVSSLATMFRFSLNLGADTTLIANEITYLEKYLDIQRYRYNNRFIFKKSIDESLQQHPVLCIVLQPFVENALLHGLRNTRDTIQILLTVVRRDDTIVFTVADDGSGCDPIAINETLILPQANTKSYGIYNIHRRICLRYGSEYGVRYLPVNVGTTVEIIIPMEE